MVKSGSINGVNFGYQKKSVKPTIRIGKSETAGKLGTAIDTMGAGGLDITLDVIAQSITERDSLIAAFMQEGRGKLKPGTPDNDWYFSGVCGDYSTDFTLSQYNPTIAYPLSFLFETDLPYLISDKVKTIGKQITAKGQEWVSADEIAFNNVKNCGFESATTTTYTLFNYWTLTTTPNPPSVLQEVYQSTAKHKYGSRCLKLVNNNRLTKFGEQYQPQNFEAGVEYTIGFYGYIENPSISEIVLDLKSNSSVVRSIRCKATDDFTLTYMTYTFQEPPTNATIHIYGSGNAGVSTSHYIDGIFCMKSSDFPDNLIGQFITTGQLGGTSYSIPDIQIDSLNIAHSMQTVLDTTIYTLSTLLTNQIKNDALVSYTPPLSGFTISEPDPVTSGGTSSIGTVNAKLFNTVSSNINGVITEIGFHVVGGYAYNLNVTNTNGYNVFEAGGYTSPATIDVKNLNVTMNNLTAVRIGIEFAWQYITITNAFYKYKIGRDYYLLKTIIIPTTSGQSHCITAINYRGYTSDSSDAVRFKVTIQNGTGAETEQDNWVTQATSSNPATRSLSNLSITGVLNKDITVRFYGKLNLDGQYTTSTISILDCSVDYNTAVPYTLLNTINIPATVNLANNITEIGFAAKTNASANPLDIKVSIEHSNTTEDFINPVFTTASENWIQYTYPNVNSISAISGYSIIRFYGQLETGLSSLLSLKDCFVNYIPGEVSIATIPQNVYIYNTGDKFTRCNICNKLLLGSSLRINTDGTGYFSYYDNYLTNLYQTVVSSQTNVTWSTGRIAINSSSTPGQISYTFDIRYPIDGVPFLILNVLSGNPQIKIAVNEQGTTGQLFSIDENTATVTAGSHLWNLYNLANCNLSESTNITIQILPPTGQTCVIGSFFFWTATITVDAELPKIFKDKINTFRVDMTEDALCLISLGIHDYKWGI
jgi:hypothetical protein